VMVTGENPTFNGPVAGRDINQGAKA